MRLIGDNTIDVHKSGDNWMIGLRKPLTTNQPNVGLGSDHLIRVGVQVIVSGTPTFVVKTLRVKGVLIP